MIIEVTYAGKLDLPANDGGRRIAGNGQRVDVDEAVGKKLVSAGRAIEVDSLQTPPKIRMQYVGRSGRWVGEISQTVQPDDIVEVPQWLANRMLAGEIGAWKER